MSKLRKHLFLFTLALGLASCATIMSGSTSQVEITSAPPGASFTATGHAGIKGTTPTVLTVGNGKAVLNYTFTLDGYEDSTVLSKPRMSHWVIGNGIFGIAGIVIGFIVDYGGTNGYIHKDVYVNLVPIGGFPESKEISEKTKTNWSRKTDSL